MKLTLMFPIALATLALGPLPSHAAAYTVSLDTGAATDLLVTTPIVNGYQFTYDNITTTVNGLPPVVAASDSTFLATYVVTNGIGVLNVTDICAQVDIDTPLAPCQAFSFSFTNLALGNASAVSADAGTNILATANTANFTLAGGSIALGGGTVDFGTASTATPEPGSLALLGTGLVGFAGLIRRKASIVG